jgi:uncharacterized protein (TIGR02646 family)
MVYFPKIERRLKYKTKKGGKFYVTYSEYHDEVSEDCQHRCVYCDVLLSESGGEGMHIDHFRPQKHFPELVGIPHNLVLACAKCNRQKWDWWPEKDGTSANGKCGFVDPFDPNRSEFFCVDKAGHVVALKDPAQYIIDLLILNRPSRRVLRRARSLNHEANELIDAVQRELDSLPSLPETEIRTRLPILAKALAQACEFRRAV